MLFNVLVHVLNETRRRAAHADILREQLDGAVGFDVASSARSTEETRQLWAYHRMMIEQAANEADSQV
jgi:hypothetical protein